MFKIILAILCTGVLFFSACASKSCDEHVGEKVSEVSRESVLQQTMVFAAKYKKVRTYWEERMTERCAEDNAAICGDLAYYYFYVLSPVQIEKSKKLAQRSCENKSGYGCWVKAMILISDPAGSAPVTEVDQAMAQACHLGYRDGCEGRDRLLKGIADFGKQEPHDPGRCSSNNIQPCLMSGNRAFQNENWEEAAKWFRSVCEFEIPRTCVSQACLKDYAMGCFGYGYLLQKRISASASDVISAYKKGCQRGSADSCLTLAADTEIGNADSADKYMALACQYGSSKACTLLSARSLPEKNSLKSISKPPSSAFDVTGADVVR